jgi:hypothetical protein
MKYMLLIYNNPAAIQAMPEAELKAFMGEVDAIMKELSQTGEMVGGAALADASRTRTVRVRDGVPMITDGPYAEAKEQFAGYLTVDCDTPERAEQIAARWPDSHYWAMEVRPLMDESGVEM